MNGKSFITSGLMMFENMRQNNKDIQAEILEQWKKSKDYPRKKKKKVRKDLEFRWMIFSYDPYDYMSF